MPEVIDVNAESSINDILAKSPDAVSEKEATPSEPSPETEQSESAEETSAEDVKTDTETQEDDVTVKDDGKPIPYQRFKEVNDKYKQIKTELEELREAQSQFDSLLQDPEVLRTIRKKQGYTEEAINAELGVNKVQEGEIDLSTTEGWKKLIQNEIQQALNPVKQTLTEAQRKEQERELFTRLDNEKVEAEKVCKESYGIEYGDEKDAKDPSTGAGKIFLYIEKHPEKAKLASQGFLSKADLLRLAIAEEGVKLGEKKGEKKEKERQTKLKAVAMEGESQAQADDFPDPSWSTQRIVEWRQKHPNA